MTIEPDNTDVNDAPHVLPYAQSKSKYQRPASRYEVWYEIWYPVFLPLIFPLTLGLGQATEWAYVLLLFCPFVNVCGIVFGAYRIPDSRSSAAGVIAIVANLVGLSAFIWLAMPFFHHGLGR